MSKKQASSQPTTKLLIAIPALNEEDSIESIIHRSLAARAYIIAHSPVTAVDITVVSDGSTDRTVELAGRYTDQIKLIVFEKNQGYGAAIKEAWRQSDAEILGFLDADGTCNPDFFAPLCATLTKENADVVLGCRLNKDSKMPLTRQVGNIIFALLLTLFSSKRVRDTASGMRVVRRSSLFNLMPLPDGLHFTPAMSARAMLSDDVKIVEINMPYSEREGQSKLSIIKDGLRFLQVIFQAAFLYRPDRPLGFLGITCLAIAAWLMLSPSLYYIQNHVLLEWMIYRFVVSNLLVTSGFLLLCIAYLSVKIVRITLSDRSIEKLKRSLITVFLSHLLFWSIPFILISVGGLLVMPSLVELVTTGSTYEHWSRFIAMSSMVSIAIILIVTRIVDYTLNLVADQLVYLRSLSTLRD